MNTDIIQAPLHGGNRGGMHAGRPATRPPVPAIALLVALLLANPAHAVDPPHLVNACAGCHLSHGALGQNLTTVAGNANLCASCHVAGGSAAATPFASADQALSWPGLAAGVSAAGTSHRWDSGIAGHTVFLGGASPASAGTVAPAGLYTGAFARTYTITISATGNVGIARFDWTSTSPAGSGASILTDPSVLLSDGLRAAFQNGTNAADVAFRVGDVWRLYVRAGLSLSTNADLAQAMTNGVTCSTCHNEHSQACEPFDAAAPAYGGSGTGEGRHNLRYDNNTDQLCAECHLTHAVTNATFGSHPVGVSVANTALYRVPSGLPMDKTAGSMRCSTCHAIHYSASTDGTLLRVTNPASLCVACHTLANTNTPAAHLNTGSLAMLWPGGQYGSLFPARTAAGDRGSCGNCHYVHGWPDTNQPALRYPSLLVDREENLCFTCHDVRGPAATDVRTVFQKTATHPATAYSGRHRADEGADPAAFGASNRHAECVDCHNPHQLRTGNTPSGTFSYRMLGVSRVRVSNGAAGTAPTYTFVPATDTNLTGLAEYQVCFKCHSGWTTLPTGATDLGIVFNPANESAHPLQGAGRNGSSYMAASLAGGTGLPHLTTNSVLTCSDCHNSDDIPRTVSLVSGYTGTVVTGPHGAGVTNADFSNKLLRAPYRTATLRTYNQTDFAFCYICHSSAPFNTEGTDPRSDTRFRFHGRHMTSYRASCKDCHNDVHGTKLALKPGNRNYAQLVNFAATVTPRSTTQPTWTRTATGGSCTLTCHTEGHSGESY